MDYQHVTIEDLASQVIVEGDLVLVAEDRRQTYRPDLKVVVVKNRKETPKTVRYFLSDGSCVVGTSKIFKINPEMLFRKELGDEIK